MSVTMPFVWIQMKTIFPRFVSLHANCLWSRRKLKCSAFTPLCFPPRASRLTSPPTPESSISFPYFSPHASHSGSPTDAESTDCFVIVGVGHPDSPFPPSWPLQFPLLSEGLRSPVGSPRGHGTQHLPLLCIRRGHGGGAPDGGAPWSRAGGADTRDQAPAPSFPGPRLPEPAVRETGMKGAEGTQGGCALGPSLDLLPGGRPLQGLPRTPSCSSECPWPMGPMQEAAKSSAVPGVVASGMSMFKYSFYISQ